MRKLLITSSFLALFILFGNTVSAQVGEITTASVEVAKELDSSTKLAVIAIEQDETLTAEKKKNFIARLEANSKFSKIQSTDDEAKKSFVLTYNRISDNYAQITGKTLQATTVVAIEEKK